MITKKEITDFFDLEAEEAKKKWKAMMSLPIKDRIRKRKAIQSVFLDRDYHSANEENYDLLRIKVGVNLSDFKEGDCLFLHKEGELTGIKCILNSFEGDEAIIIEVFPLNMPGNLDGYYDIPLVLDKDLVDLREYVIYPFTATLPPAYDSFWKGHLINTKPSPSFEDMEKCDEELKDTEENFKLSLLPTQREAILKSMAAKDYYLIQGPPGTGKSFVLGYIILEEIAFFNHKVVVIGPNHMAINNALEQVLKNCTGYYGSLIKVGQAYNAPKLAIQIDEQELKITNIHHLDSCKANSSDLIWAIGMTPYCFYTNRARGLECDTLIIDEAGQETIPLALMGMLKAKKIILAGDHKQLPPIITSDEVPQEMRQSIFQTLITDENCTMLDVSFRMCKPICDFVSELFYDGKLKPYKTGCGDKIICQNPLYSFDKPVILHHIDDNGKQTSDKEAEFVSDTIAGFLKQGLPAEEIAVLSPFRAQAANVRRHIRKHESIPEEARTAIVANTIDKMQGQEREVIIFSLVAGDYEYMTEMADFLYNPNKLTVAFSRAKSKLIIVGNVDQLAKISIIDYPYIHAMLKSKYIEKI